MSGHISAYKTLRANTSEKMDAEVNAWLSRNDDAGRWELYGEQHALYAATGLVTFYQVVVFRRPEP
jgi:hypothetical protein